MEPITLFWKLKLLLYVPYITVIGYDRRNFTCLPLSRVVDLDVKTRNWSYCLHFQVSNPPIYSNNFLSTSNWFSFTSYSYRAIPHTLFRITIKIFNFSTSFSWRDSRYSTQVKTGWYHPISPDIYSAWEMVLSKRLSVF